MKLRSLLLLACLCLYTVCAYSGTLKGKITDTKGEELPFATVFIQGTTNGTTANADGEYTLQLPAGTHKVTCQYMGFKAVTFNVTFTGDETVTHSFSLLDQSLQMKEAVVRANAEDPAYAIIRKTIKRRKFHLQQVRSFQASIYLKGVFRFRDLPKSFFGEKIDKNEMGADTSGKGLLYLCEEEADYYSKGEKERTIVKAVRESGDPNGLGMARLPSVVTFYENNVDVLKGISPRGFISPISDNAIYYYKFKYEGEFRENGYVIDKIKVIPRRQYEPLFTGTIYIVEEDWAIHSLDLWVDKRCNMELLDTLNVKQVHLPLAKDTWVVKDQVLYPTVKMFGFDITGYFVTVYNKQKVNEAIPDSLFDKRIESSYVADANKKDTGYWQDRPVPLQADESRDYVVKDSIRIREEDPKYIDSMRRIGNKVKLMDLVLGGFHYRSKANKHIFQTNALLSGLVNFNSVEGVNVAPKVNWIHRLDSSNVLRGKVAARYGFSNARFNAMGRLEYIHDSRTWITRQWRLGIEGGRYVFQYNPNSTLTPFLNTFTTLVIGDNFMKIYEGLGGAVYFQRNFGNGLNINARADYRSRTSLSNTTNYSWAKDPRIEPNVPRYLNAPSSLLDNDAAIIKLGVSYRPGHTYTIYPQYKYPKAGNYPLFAVEYQKGVPNILNSTSDFDKWKFTVSDDMNLKLLGSLSYKISAGGFLNKKFVAVQDMMHLADNELLLAAPFMNSFQIAEYYKYSNTENVYGELHLEYALKGLLTNKLPLLRQAKWYMVMGTNTFYASTKNYYAEAFVGVDHLGYKAFRFLRVDFVYSWNSLNQTNYGFRIGFDPNSIIRFNLGDRSEEW